MTRAQVEEQAIVFLDAPPMSIPINEEPQCVEALVKFILATEAACLEEAAKMAEVKADNAKNKSFKQYNHGYRSGLCGFASELREQAAQRRTG